jgi:lipopolysaccharide heptosyltransferase I
VKILILKPSSLGDVVQSLPVLRLLKLHLPASQIYWWIDTKLAPLLEGDPDLAGVVRFHRRRWAAPQHWPEIVRSIWWIRKQGFDWVIDLQGLMRSGIFAWLANGGLTVGVDEPREGARGLYDVVVQRPSRQTHAVDWYLQVLPALGVPVHWKFQWLPERPALAADLRQKWPMNAARWVGLQPGARWANKRWPVEYYAELLRDLSAKRPELRFAVFGGEDERALGETITKAGGERCLDLTGKLSLPEMVEWLRRIDLLVTNDTGPMHVAAALGKPVVAMFGPTTPLRTGPYRQLDHVLQLQLPCVPCLNSRCWYSKPMECLRALPPSAAVQAALDRLASSSSVA